MCRRSTGDRDSPAHGSVPAFLLFAGAVDLEPRRLRHGQRTVRSIGLHFLLPPPLPFSSLIFPDTTIIMMMMMMQMYDMVGLPLQAGVPNLPLPAAGGPSSSGTGIGGAATAGGTGGAMGASGRDQFLKTLNWDGPAGDPRERGHYSR